MRSVGTHLLQKRDGGSHGRDCSVGGVEDLEPQPVFPHAEIADLAQIPRIDVAPGIPFPGLGLFDIVGKIPFVFVGLDDVAYPQGVDIGAWKAAREAPRTALAAQFRGRVGVFGIVVVLLFEGEVVVVGVGLGEADAVRRLRAGDDHLLDAELARRFDHVVRAEHVAPEALAVGDQHVARVRGEVDDGVRGPHARAVGPPRVLVVAEVEMRRQRVEGLPGVGEIRF